jgi:hypothetical protein
MTHQVLFLHLVFKFDLEHAKHTVGRIIKVMRCPVHRGMHSRTGLGMLIVTTESAQELVERIRPVLDDIESLENFWCYVAPQPDDVVGRHGGLDPLCHRLRKAWVDAGDWNKAQDIRRRQSWQRRR